MLATNCDLCWLAISSRRGLSSASWERRALCTAIADAHAHLDNHIEDPMRSRLRNILYLHGLAARRALADNSLAEANRMCAHRGDEFVTHVAGGFEHPFAPGLVEHINR